MARRKKESPRQDGYVNVLTRLGTVYDKRTAHKFTAKTLTYPQCEELWRGSDLGSRIVERPVDEMLRQGWDVSVPNDKGRQDAVGAQLEDLEATERLREALYYARAYGGGAVLVGADDGTKDMSNPLGKVRAIKFLTTLTSDELRAAEYYDNALDEKFGQPKTYLLVSSEQKEIAGGGTKIHESRLLVFHGNVTSRRMLQLNHGWGDSIFVRVSDVLRDFDVTWESSAVLMNDFAQTIYKIKGLAEIIASQDPEAAGALTRRLQFIEMCRSVIRGALVDSEESCERQQTPISGLPEMLEKWMFRLAAASEMPVSMLFGQAPAGLNATGDADIRFYYDHLRVRQDRTLRPPLERLIRMVFQADGGKEPDQWHVAFRPLWQLTEAEKANMHVAQANADQVYLANGVVSSRVVQQSRFGNGYSVETVLIPGEEPTAPLPQENAPGATPIPPNGESPDGTKPLESVQGVGSARKAIAPVAEGGDIQKTAFTGIQVTSMVEVLEAVAQRRLPRESAIMLLMTAFQLEQGTAEALLGPIGTSFFAEEKQAAPKPLDTVVGAGGKQP